MESKRSDNRRRRVLYDEAVQQAPVSPNSGVDTSTAKRRRSNNYGTRGNQQLKTSDLIPIRWLTIGLIATASLIAIGVVNVLHWYALNPANALDGSTRAALQLTSPNGLATWLATVTFVLASLYSLQNFAMRRYRRDDYRGTYRVWLALAALFLLASILCVVPLDRCGALVLSHAIQLPAFAQGEVGIVSIKLALLLAVFIRTLVEIRFCRSATMLLALSLLVYASAAIVDMPSISRDLVRESRWFADNLQLVGALVLLHCVIAYSRYVCLDVQGMLARRARRKRKRKSRSAKHRELRAPATAPTATTPRSQPVPVAAANAASTKPQSSPTAKPVASPATTTSAIGRDSAKHSPLKSKMDALKSNSDVDDSDDDDDSWEDDDGETSGNSNQRLSKAERRRLKKLHRQQRNAA